MSNTYICNEVNTVDYANMVIQDQLLRGIADQEIIADLLGDEKSDRLTSDIVDFIARNEQAKSERGTVAGDSTATGVIAQKQGDAPAEVVVAQIMEAVHRDLVTVQLKTQNVRDAR